jgi:tRNA-2-methylthio-N6-dimethylallyladenosine synthase
MNEYDSDKMADVLGAHEEIVKTDNPEEADVILFNTCSVREKAQERVFHDLGRVRLLKQEEARPDHRRRRLRRQPGGRGDRRARALCGRGVRPADPAPPAAADRRARKPRALAGGHLLPGDREVRQPAAGAVEGASAFVSIMEGCSKYCTFCVVPYTRGEEVSRPLDDVLTEVAGLAAQGVKEVTLLGQNVNAYRGAMAGGEEQGRLCLPARVRRRDPRHRAHPLHHLAPARDDAAPDRRATPRCPSWCRTCTCRCSRAPTACWRR